MTELTIVEIGIFILGIIGAALGVFALIIHNNMHKDK